MGKLKQCPKCGSEHAVEVDYEIAQGIECAKCGHVLKVIKYVEKTNARSGTVI